MRPRGVPEVPQQQVFTITDKNGIDRQVSILTPQHQQWMSDVREQLLQIRQRQAVPDAPTNLRATAQALSNLLQWTRSSDADYYEVLAGLTPALNQSGLQTIDVGNSAQYLDHVGQSAIQKFYWVRARKRTGASSLEVGPVNATTLISTVGVTPPVPPPPSNILVHDQSTGRVIAYTLSSPRSLNHV